VWTLHVTEPSWTPSYSSTADRRTSQQGEARTTVNKRRIAFWALSNRRARGLIIRGLKNRWVRGLILVGIKRGIRR